MRRITGIVTFLVATLWFYSASALKYRPADDETLSHVALIHYGDPNKYVYIAAANGIADPDRLPKGINLWVPTVVEYRVKKGDSLAEIAKKYLKDAEKVEFLAWLNQLKDAKVIEPGMTLVVPFILRHRVESGQSLVDVARRYYFKPQMASLLRKFNDRRTNVLKSGETVLVPIFDPEATYQKVTQRLEKYRKQQAEISREVKQITSGGLTAVREDANLIEKGPADATATGQEEKPPASLPEQKNRLSEALNLYQEGEFELARASLEQLLEKGHLTLEDELQARFSLASALVALEKPKEAEHEFVRLLMLRADFEPDPVTTSPKVLEIFRRAGGGK